MLTAKFQLLIVFLLLLGMVIIGYMQYNLENQFIILRNLPTPTPLTKMVIATPTPTITTATVSAGVKRYATPLPKK